MNNKLSLLIASVVIALLASNISHPKEVIHGEINTLDDTTKLQAITQHNGLVIVDFYADWCGPCKNLMPILKRIAEKNKDILVVKVNIEKHRSESKKHKVRSIPTLLFFKDGKLLQREVGFISEKEIQKIIRALQA